MGIPEGREWFFGDSAMAIDRAATRRTERMKGEAMGRRRGEQNGMKGEAMGWRWGDNNGRKAKRWNGDGVTTMGE